MGSKVCSIRVVLKIESDDEALAAKKKIDEVLKDIKDKSVNFSIIDNPTRQPMG